MFEHTERLNITFTWFTGEIVLCLRLVRCQTFFGQHNKRLIQQSRHNRWLSFRNGMKMEWKLKCDYKLGIKHIRRFAERENRKKCFKGHCWALRRVGFFKIFIVKWLVYNVLWDETGLLCALIPALITDESFGGGWDADVAPLLRETGSSNSSVMLSRS